MPPVKGAPQTRFSLRYRPNSVKKTDATLDDLRHLVALSAVAPRLAGPDRDAVDGIVGDLAVRIGPAVSKRRAAAVLGISVPALDEWIRRGRVEVTAAPGARAGVDTASLVRTAALVPPGASRPGRAVDRALAEQRRPAELWRVNEAVTAAEGRAFAALPFAERITQLERHYKTIGALASVRRRPRADAPPSTEAATG